MQVKFFLEDGRVRNQWESVREYSTALYVSRSSSANEKSFNKGGHVTNKLERTDDYQLQKAILLT